MARSASPAKIAQLQAAADAAYEAHNAAMGRCLNHLNSETTWRDVGDTQAAYYRAHAALIAAQYPGEHGARLRLKLTALDARIAELQAAYDAALKVEAATYSTWLGLDFGEADYEAEQAWRAAQAECKRLHETLLTVIDARRDASAHDLIIPQNSPISNTCTEARP